MDIWILFALIILNGIFAMSEIALITARRAQLQNLAQAGDGAAAAAIELGEDPNRFLSTIQIGITLIGILNGFIGERALAGPFSAWIESLGVQNPAAEYLARGIVVVAITYFTIVLGELVPKRLGQINPGLVARLIARPMLWLSVASKPFVKLLSGSTQLILRIFGIKERSGPSVTQEEIQLLLAEGTDAGVIEHQEHEMVRNVFRLDDRQIASLMLPRSDVVYLDVEQPLEDNIKRIEASEHSRFPVIKGNWEDVLGVASARQFLTQTLHGEKPSLTENLQPPVFVPESLTGMELLENFKNSAAHLAFVIDEYGEVQGIVTLQDVMEAITGEFKPTRPEDAWAMKRDDGSWLLDGFIPIPELKDRLGIKEVPEEEKGRYNTLSGMIMLLVGRLPQTADRCEWEGWTFEVVDMDGKRIDKVLAIPKSSALEEVSSGLNQDR
ncbi:putative hemolysin [Nitrosospira multiformis]|uniref:Putative hemolysin n=1 Tax=Nitrosospira multiformis TaxID=1231 RepID=A0A2T5I1X2_9PROT|nr:hemolysin family protein [Nitrosospira multiformis]PTQ77827.1 putative hemolysin [Nitrosospira multiformis]